MPITQTADDELPAQGQKLKAELVRLVARQTRKLDPEILAEIDAVTGRTPRELATGMARLIDKLRTNSLGNLVNLRGLLATASKIDNPNWGGATIESVLAETRSQPPPKPAVNAEDMLASARALEAAQRQRQT
jgi:hypothetical protein